MSKREFPCFILTHQLKLNKNLQIVCDIRYYFLKDSAKNTQHCGNTHYNGDLKLDFISFTNIMMKFCFISMMIFY